MGDTDKTTNNQGVEASHGSSLPTRTIYTAVVSVVVANIIAGLTLLVRNPVDEIDQLEERLNRHIYQADKRMDRIEREHAGFDILLGLPTRKSHSRKPPQSEQKTYLYDEHDQWTE